MLFGIMMRIMTIKEQIKEIRTMPDLDEIRNAAREGKLDAPPLKMAPHWRPGCQAEVGMLVLLSGRFRGHAVISGFRRITKGRAAGKVEYQLAPWDEGQFGPKAYGCRIIGEQSFGAPRIEATAEQAQDRMEGRYTAARQVAELKEARAEAGREAIGGKQLESGNRVWVNWSDGRRIETIVEINPTTGKVAIERRNNKTGKRWIRASIVGEKYQPEQ